MRDREEIISRVDEIIDSVEETLVPVACMDDDGQCACDTACVSHTVWQGLGEKIRQFLASMTLADLTNEARQQSTTNSSKVESL